MTAPSTDVTRLLHEASAGNRTAVDELLPLVYDELRALARSKLRFESEGHTLSATALVHEAYMKLVDQTQVEWQNRSHFFAVAAESMRRILISYARARNAEKRGHGVVPESLDHVDELLAGGQDEALIDLDDALTRLADFNERGARVVTYRYFGGMSHKEIAEVLGTSVMTVRRSWDLARAWLRRELSDTPQPGSA
ncbi:MAG: sigma-70 family RNA polymerase sigma factor [Gemmatimonadota bacterium]